MCIICASRDQMVRAASEGQPIYDPTGTAGYAAVAQNVSADLTLVLESVDAADSTATGDQMSVGQLFEGRLTTTSDSDWVEISLEAGQAYVFLAYGVNGAAAGSEDTVLTLRDASGSALATNDDIAPNSGNLFSLIEYTPTTSGTFYLEVEAFDATGVGDYQIMAATDVLTVEQAALYIAEVDWGFPTPIYFAQDSLTVNLTGLTSEGQQLARWALEAWSLATGLTFTETTAANANLRFDDDQPGAFAGPGNFNPSTGVNAFSSINVSTDWIDTFGSTIDSFSYETYLHEIGHALGLGHPGAYDGNAAFGSNFFANDSTLMSVMSYFSPDENPNVAGGSLVVTTPMLADLEAVHYSYGTPQAYEGNTTWGANSNVGGSMGTLFGILYDGDTADPSFYSGDNDITFTVFDTGGTDTLDFSTVGVMQRIDLRQAQLSNVGGVESGMAIAVDTIIENAIGGTAADLITGNDADNQLQGGAGNDTLAGGLGDDTLIGGAGTDAAVFDIAFSAVSVTDLGNGAIGIASSQGNDRTEGIETFEFADGTLTLSQLQDSTGGASETVTGTDGDDTLSGGTGADTLSGGAGNDLIAASAGDDVVDGGDGDDMIGGGPGSDTISGGADNDTIGAGQGDDQASGDAGDDIVNGGAGNDTLMGASFGDDSLSGGSGADSLGGGTGKDTLDGGVGADSLGGGEGDDSVLGGDGNDFLAGGGRNDVIDGGAGADRVNGGSGNDTMTGGLGNDLFIFNRFNAGEEDVITDFAIGIDTLRMTGVTGQGQTGKFLSLSIVDVNSGTQITYEGHTITLEGVAAITLDQDDFTFL